MRGLTITMMVVLLVIWTCFFLLGCRLTQDDPMIVKVIGIFTCVFSAFQFYDTIHIYLNRKPPTS